MTDYEQLREKSAAQDPLAWRGQHKADLPILAQFARQYMCIPASSCASERVFSTSGNICSPRRSRLSEEHLDILVFLAKNLNKTKSLRLYTRISHLIVGKGGSRKKRHNVKRKARRFCCYSTVASLFQFQFILFVLIVLT